MFKGFVSFVVLILFGSGLFSYSELSHSWTPLERNNFSARLQARLEEEFQDLEETFSNGEMSANGVVLSVCERGIDLCYTLIPYAVCFLGGVVGGVFALYGATRGVDADQREAYDNLYQSHQALQAWVAESCQFNFLEHALKKPLLSLILYKKPDCEGIMVDQAWQSFEGKASFNNTLCWSGRGEAGLSMLPDLSQADEGQIYANVLERDVLLETFNARQAGFVWPMGFITRCLTLKNFEPLREACRGPLCALFYGRERSVAFFNSLSPGLGESLFDTLPGLCGAGSFFMGSVFFGIANQTLSSLLQTMTHLSPDCETYALNGTAVSSFQNGIPQHPSALWFKVP